MSDSVPVPSLRVASILLAGGRGTRAAFAHPKQLQPLGGKPLLRWSLDALSAHPRVSGGVLVASDDVMALTPELPEGWIFAAAGAERQQSVENGLLAIADWEDDALVLVHDAARPGIEAAVIDRLLGALETAEAAIPTLPV